MKSRILSFFLAMLMIITSAPLFVIQSGAEEASQEAGGAFDYDALYVPGALIKYDFFDFTNDGSFITKDDGYGSVETIEHDGFTYDYVGVYKRDRHVRFYDREEIEDRKMYAVSSIKPTKPDLTASKGKTYTFQFVVKYMKNAGHLDIPHARMTFKDNGGYVDMSSATQLLKDKVDGKNAWITASSFTNESGAANSGVLVGDTYDISCFALYDSENINPYEGAGTVKVAVKIGDMKKSFEYSYTADNPIRSANYVGLGGYGKSGEFYAYRVYDRALTDEEINQNHFADLAKFYRFDPSDIETLFDMPDYLFEPAYEKTLEMSVDAEISVAEGQAAFKKILNDAVEEASKMNLPELSELLDFTDYCARLRSYPGIRAQFVVNNENLAKLEEQGYEVEAGVIIAVNDGKEYSDLTVYNNEGTYETLATKALTRAVYKTGEGENGFVDKYYEEDGEKKFVYAIVYEQESSQTAEYYATNCMYRAYAVAKKEGSADIVVYFDCESPLFGEDISIYDLTAYHAYEEGTKASDDTFMQVIEKAGYTTDMNDAIALLNDCNTKFAAGEEITFSDLNKLYNYQLKANKDSYFKAQMKYYEPNDGTLTLEKGSNDDLYELINTFWGIYNTKLGVDIRDSLYEIGTGSVEVYFEDISDTVEGNKKAYEYKTGDDVVFKLALRQKGTNILFPCTSFTYKYRIDGVVDASGKTIEYTGTQVDDDGIFELTIPASEIAKSTTLTANKGALIELLVNATSEEASLLCEGGATNKGYAGSVVINFDDLKPTQPKPDDYETFWAEQIERLENTDPTDSTVPTETTRYSATTHEDIAIAHDVDLTNYFHITKFDKALLASYREKGLSSASDTYLDSHDAYEISLKAPGPNPTTGILVIPKNKTNLNASLSFAGYGVSAPTPSFSNSAITFNVTHHGYPSGQAKTYYDQLFKNGGILGSYGSGKNKPNSTYINKDDCYILYMFLRNLQAVRFIDECLDKDTTGLAADAQDLYANLKRAFNGNILVSGGSMGGYQTLGTASLASMAGYNVIKASPSIPALCNSAGYTLEGRVNNIFVFGYEITDNGKDYNNMDYFDGAFFAEYIECETVFTKVGLGDYTCPPSGIIIAYNALKCKKSMNLYQNAQHDYWPTRVVDGVTVDTNPIYKFASEAVTE